jgi:pimeloyl-ACP methyl ester carboxylesterase
MRRMIRRILCVGLVLLTKLTGSAGRLGGQEPAAEKFPVPTLGGKQFWADELFFHQWRIQRHSLTGHCRLLDEHDRRHAWGTYDDCQTILERIKRERRLRPMSGKAVVVLHGLVRSRSSMDSLCRHLREKGGYEVFNVEYPSTQYDMADSARALAHIIDNLAGVEEVNFVGHSMGNIVIRHYLGDLARKGPGDGPAGAAARRARPHFGRFVMLGPPNQGALLATALADNVLFKGIAGEAGQQLGRDWLALQQRLATPNFEFGIIAGGRGDKQGYNPLLRGDNDGVVGVETAKLAGARDFVVLPVLHSFLMDNAQVQQCVLSFLEHGYFVSADQRRPLERSP